MKNLMNQLIKQRIMFHCMFAALLFVCGNAASAIELGKDYKLLNPSQPTDTKKIEVLEFFSYSCSHCFHLHPYLSAWEKAIPKDVELYYVPTIFGPSAEPFGITYYALESMGQSQQLHDVLYRAIHVENTGIYDFDTIATYVEKRGVDRAKFLAAYNSFSVQSKVMRAKQMIRSYGINGTPTLVVDGKYLITGLQPPDTIRVLKEVIELARKDHPAVSSSKPPTKARH